MSVNTKLKELKTLFEKAAKELNKKPQAELVVFMAQEPLK
jgi:hypothetical protein